ncbi:TDT family transporter [Staphylococcus lutrae]|nr:TDT family transporter [Staphylococcus lutrae]
MDKKRWIQYLEVIPLPMSGLMLALLSCGIFLSSLQWDDIAFVFVCLASLIALLLHLKVFLVPQDCLQQLHQPVILSVFPTFSMSMMLFCVLLHALPAFEQLSLVLWGAAIVLHTVLSIKFIIKMVFKTSLSMETLFPSWFIPFVGFGMITVTAPHFNAIILGQWMLWISFIGYLILLPFIVAKIVIYRDLVEGFKPLIIILSTPGSLCLAGYFVVVEQHHYGFVIILYTISQLSYFIAIAHLPQLLKLPFYPSYAAFTFPLVISATVSNSVWQLGVIHHPLFGGLVVFELSLAFVMVIYVLYRYSAYLYRSWRTVTMNISQ